ncbi:MAG: hypothetical protein Q4A15_10950 [Prevotellaceae bacterium]|nr:hypothetical protein [Prevotellaceae bacterium]
MRILWYFLAYSQGATKPVIVWVEAKNQEAARNLIQRENPYVTRLVFQRSKRIE